jgi:peptidoglycan/xylan/chitin deacetylase (PgdA/CDA1 family)
VNKGYFYNMLKNISKHLLYYSLYRSGLFKKGNAGRLLILMYHGVTEKDHTARFGRHLPAKQFEEHLLYFKKHFNILTLEEILKESAVGSRQVAAGSRQQRKPLIALTFDDGFENNLYVALPLLEKHKVPATFYIPTAALAGEILAADKIDIVRNGSKEKELIFNSATYIRKGQHRLLNKTTGENIYNSLLQLSPGNTRTALDIFSERYHFNDLLKQTDPECYRLMNGAQLKQFSSSPYVSIGSHAHTHFALSLCSNIELAYELSFSKTELERITGKKVDSVAFPYGAHNAAVVEQSKEKGYSNLLSAGRSEFKDVLPRAGIISAGSFEQNMLHVHRSFDTFGL